MLVHLGMGAGLGLFLSLSLILSDGMRVSEMIMNSSTPKTTMALFVALVSALIAVGASLSGFIFTAMENHRE